MLHHRRMAPVEARLQVAALHPRPLQEEEAAAVVVVVVAVAVAVEALPLLLLVHPVHHLPLRHRQQVPKQYPALLL